MPTEVTIKMARPRVEQLFAPYKELIGKDYPGYRNHVYRDITYAMHFLDYDDSLEPLVETAFVYHDIGLWTDHMLAYLEPSEAVALADNEKYAWGFDAEALKGAIHWHHKITPYHGPHERLINACRKADWVDLTRGAIRKGLSKNAISEVEAAFPNLGFQATLMRLAKDYGGSTLKGSIEVTRGIVKW